MRETKDFNWYKAAQEFRKKVNAHELTLDRLRPLSSNLDDKWLDELIAWEVDAVKSIVAAGKGSPS